MPRDAATQARMLRLPEVLERTGLSRSTIYSLMSDGDFPQPRKLTSALNGWRESEVEAWIASRPVARIGATGCTRAGGGS